MLRQMLAERDAALASATTEIEHLRLQLKVLKRSQFGRSSEKLDAEIDQLELRLEDLEESEAERIATITTRTVGEHRRRVVAVRKPLPDHLPREIVVHEPSVDCDCGIGRKLSKLGEDATEVLEKIPARLKVIRHIRPKYACRCCERIFQAAGAGSADRQGQTRPRPARQYRRKQVL